MVIDLVGQTQPALLQQAGGECLGMLFGNVGFGGQFVKWRMGAIMGREAFGGLKIRLQKL